jgi:GTP pyrophosphokinase
VDFITLQKEHERHFPDHHEGRQLIAEAFDFARHAHRNHKRASGDDYIVHLHETALRLARWKLDAETIAAGILHDVIEDCHVTEAQLSERFGDTITFLVQGVTKLGSLKYRGPQEHNAENLRKMMLAISKDLRVVFIKLADRLHNMETLHHIPPSKQKRIALETIEIYAPLASRLGMQSLSGTLQDLAFPYLHPKEYKWLKTHVQEPYEAREHYLKQVEPLVRKELEKAGVAPVRIDYRAKRLYSLFKKLQRYDMNLENIYDLVALRIITKDVQACYATLGIIHQMWPPMPGRIKDYIALPKPNGYQSLHTTVFSLNRRPAEFQIRTMQMHEHAEYGVAAHWAYEHLKSSKHGALHAAAHPEEVAWVGQLKSWQQQFPGSQEFLEALKVDLFSDRIFILTPKGKVFDLPIGSTPVDFAYRVHTDIGNSCTGAKINNKMVSLETPLQSGDVVEILTQKSKKPSESWLRFAKTTYAKKKIRSTIKKEHAAPPKVEFRVGAHQRPGMLKDISSVFSRNHISIEQIETLPSHSALPVLKIVADIKHKDKARDLCVKIKKIKGVEAVSYQMLRPETFLIN